MKHWTDRPLLWAQANLSGNLYKGSVVVVTKANIKPLQVKYALHIGAKWLQENFPLSYVGFMTFLMSHTSEWNKQGWVSCNRYDYEYYIIDRAKDMEKKLKIQEDIEQKYADLKKYIAQHNVGINTPIDINKYRAIKIPKEGHRQK